MSFLGTSSMPYTSLLLIPTVSFTVRSPRPATTTSPSSPCSLGITQCQSVLAALRAHECHASMLLTLYALAFWAAYLAVWYFSFVASRACAAWSALCQLLWGRFCAILYRILFIRRIVQIWYIRKGNAEVACVALRRTCRTAGRWIASPSLHEVDKTIPMLWGHLKEFIKFHLEHIAGFMSVDGGTRMTGVFGGPRMRGALYACGSRWACAASAALQYGRRRDPSPSLAPQPALEARRSPLVRGLRSALPALLATYQPRVPFARTSQPGDGAHSSPRTGGGGAVLHRGNTTKRACMYAPTIHPFATAEYESVSKIHESTEMRSAGIGQSTTCRAQDENCRA
ncbi:hypothetical protein B0H17DRAFT_1205935 [Mycena rosella]|uniref:Uncharacterized protein n=1 Tax=Mycena rosella TaxID=1033263 RepID=A0AAD7D6P1_MYCRO|nr:hypothetical protein B0H17DRAFT_1205935 [Mycena rosella]